MKKLTQEEIKQRLIRLRNVEKLYEAQKIQLQKEREKNKALQERIKKLEQQDKDKDALLQKFSLELEELKIKVFGKKKDIVINQPFKSRVKKTKKRTSTSYQRVKPKDEEVTKHINHKRCLCHTCNTPLKNTITKDFYTEDIILPTNKPLKTVIKETIIKGYCSACRTQKYAIKPPKAPVILGNNIKIYICYLSILLRLSYSQIHLHLKTSYNISLSDGEITRILKEEAKHLLPAYETLKANILKQKGVHYDETTWKVQGISEGNYAWVATGCETQEAVFLLGKSRGKGNAEVLKGNSNAVGISDDYGAYRNIFKEHQLCWAHPYRKMRDLAHSGALTESVRKQCTIVYEEFGKVYEDLRNVISKGYDVKVRKSAYKRLGKVFDALTVSLSDDPLKLQKIKEALRRNREKYFTCLWHDGIPTDNNKAERALRHLVLKRRMSFGSKSSIGADVTAVLYSVFLSLWWKKPDDFFGELMSVRVV